MLMCRMLSADFAFEINSAFNHSEFKRFWDISKAVNLCWSKLVMEPGISACQHCFPESKFWLASPSQLAEGWRGIHSELLSFASIRLLNASKSILLWTNQSDIALFTLSAGKRSEIWGFWSGRVSPVERQAGVGGRSNQFPTFLSCYPTSSVSPTENHQFARR